RCPELIASLLGVFLAGGVLLTLDRKLPAARLRLMMEEAKAGCLVYVGEARPEDGWLRELGSLTIVSLPAGRGAAGATAGTAGAAGTVEPFHGAPAAAFADPLPDDPAYIFFTSGTTGRPKAVLGRQKGLSHFLTWQRETFGIGPGDRAAQLTGLSFDVVLRDIFLPLTSGATLYLPDEEDLSPERILSWLAARAITVLHTVPSLAGAWLSGAAPGFGSEALRFSFFAGEPLLDQVVERWRAAFPRTRVVNLYGPTETTLAKCFYEVPDPPALRVQPVGSPLPQTQALVLASTVRSSADASSRPRGSRFILCGIGEVGEIVLRTPFRSLGYLDNPFENRVRFRPNPFRLDADDADGANDANDTNDANDVNDVSDLLYFTGDRGRYRLDGTLEILGRLDEQVKIRGVRVEPAEVRALLCRHDTVGESAVVFREIQPGDHRLVAYVVLRPGAVLDAEALRRHLRQDLPEVMIPAAFVALDALPLTPNGKLDTASLPAPAWSGGGERAPSTPVEEITAGLWAELLDLSRVGADDNFFELGGHSLIGAQLISRLRQALGVDLPLRVLFEAPTVAGLAAEIERRRRGAGAPERRTIASFRQDRGSPPPLSFAQERYWAGRHLEARTVASTIPMMMRLLGPLDLVCLWRALSAVVDRHELLRTSFREGAAGPVQVVHPAVPTHLPVVDLERIGADERMAEVRHWSILDGQLHFDYERPPLFRLTLFRCAAEEHILLFTVHHIASDGWSRSVLQSEVSALYIAFRAGRPSPLPPLAAQFQDFARWQRHIPEGEALARQVTFWREHLSGAVPVDLGAGRSRPGRRTFAAGVVSLLVSEELERQLEALSARYGVTLFMTLLAAFKALVHHETGRDDLVVPCS
ncbi:MAG: AMP-binding protein, partial [Acidobacteriota bacterium]|nr:AMP-binding protein [Acidobacteriota bacterium]